MKVTGAAAFESCQRDRCSWNIPLPCRRLYPSGARLSCRSTCILLLHSSAHFTQTVETFVEIKCHVFTAAPAFVKQSALRKIHPRFP